MALVVGPPLLGWTAQWMRSACLLKFHRM